MVWGGHLCTEFPNYVWVEDLAALPWGLYQISKYIKNDISHVSHWQAEVSPEKIKRLK